MSRGRYIVNAWYDWAFFLLPPTVALCLGVLISDSAFSSEVFSFAGFETTTAELALGTVVHAHLVAVFFRSHNNRSVFERYRWRFVAVPLVLYAAIVSSAHVAITATVVATFWDVWHSGAQTFGFARIYDRNAGVPPELGRRLDFWVNQLLYAGPILAGVTLYDHLDAFENFEDIGVTLFTAVPATVGGVQAWLTWAVVVGGTALIAAYVAFQIVMARRGYKPSPLKILLVSSTGLCSIYSWGFNSWGEAFFIMNLFHAVQYLALVWATERERIMKRLRAPTPRRGAAMFLGLVLIYGFGAQNVDPGIASLWAITLVVSLMHFWYDGFIWSVKKNQV